MEFDFSPIADNWRFFASGLGVTVALSLISAVTSILAGLAIALLRLYGPGWLRPVLVFYIDTQRAIPVLVVLVWFYFAVPILTGISFHPFWAALMALTLHIAAYVAEIVRAGIESIRPGQTRGAWRWACRARRSCARWCCRRPLVRMLPAFGSMLSITIKDTAIATVIAVPELMKRAETIAGQSYRPIEVFTVVMVIYFIDPVPRNTR
jgi:polar amino acid transport system permease protein